MNDDEATREVAWVAREAREIVAGRAFDDTGRLAAFHERKARLLRHIASRPQTANRAEVEQLAAAAEQQAAAYADHPFAGPIGAPRCDACAAPLEDPRHDV